MLVRCCFLLSLSVIFGKSAQLFDATRHKNYRLLPLDCGYVDTSDKIVNGKNAALGEFPWMALLSYKFKNGSDAGFLCGGTILNKNYILTAAHCLTQTELQLTGVRVGEYDLSSTTDCETRREKIICNPPVRDLSILEAIPHESYSSMQKTNDIGLLRVSQIDLSQVNTKPICLPTEYSGDERGLVTGWGVTKNGKPSSILQKAHLPIIPFSDCQNDYRHSFNLTSSTVLCAGGRDKDSCGGDSGGPLTLPQSFNDDVRFVQYGIVSFGPVNNLCGKNVSPGVYTKVLYYMKWILTHINP